MEIRKYYNIIIEKLIEWTEQLVKMLPNFVLAIVVLILFVFIGKLIRNLSKKVFDRTLNNKSLASIISKVIYI